MRSPFRRSVVVTLAAVLAGALHAVSLGADLPEIQKRGTLRVLAVNEGLFFTLSPKALPGFDREMLDGFCRLHRLKLVVVPMPNWDAVIPSLLAGKGDVIAGGYAITDSREKQIAFTKEVFPSRKVVMTLAPHPVVTSLAALRTEKVGTVKGTSMAEAVAAAGVPEENVVYLPSGTLPAALRAGKVSAVVLGVEHAIKEHHDSPKIQLGLFLGAPGSLAFGLREGDAELKAALDDYIENVRKTPTWSRLVVKYLGESAPEILKKARASQ
jgi:lysine/arginine/ornithine transport system substrate-binding protein